MTDEGSREELGDNEVRVYVGGGELGTEADAIEFHAKRVDSALKKVKLSDEELERMRTTVQRIATKLQPPPTSAESGSFAVDSVTLHIGLSAAGTLFFVSAGAEAALDITWRRSG